LSYRRSSPNLSEDCATLADEVGGVKSVRGGSGGRGFDTPAGARSSTTEAPGICCGEQRNRVSPDTFRGRARPLDRSNMSKRLGHVDSTQPRLLR